MSLEQALEDNTQAVEMLAALIAPLVAALGDFSAQIAALSAEPPKRRTRERAPAPDASAAREAAAVAATNAAPAPTPAPTSTAAAAPTPSATAATSAASNSGDLFEQIRTQLGAMGTQRDKIVAVFASFGIQRASEAPASDWPALLEALKAA